MNKFLPFIFATVLAGTAVGSAQAQEELVYIAVEPCRIADTRQSTTGVIQANTFRNFIVAGDAGELAVQGGTADCLNPKGSQAPVAVSAYIVAVPAASSTRNGALTAYPSELAPPPPGTGSTVNFALGQTIGNTTTVTVCSEDDCPASGELAILARNTDEHVVIDVQGYFYPPTMIPGYQVVGASFVTAGSNSVLAQAVCPAGKRVLGGGGRLGVSDWILDGSYPVPDGTAWRVRYKTSGSTFSVAGEVWAICASVN